MKRRTILTPRLELRLGNPETYSIPPADRTALATNLSVTVPESWPVEHYDEDALRSSREGSPLRYIILRKTNTLIGILGGGQLDATSVMIGYSIAPEHQRLGYATEALKALVKVIFANPRVQKIVAETYPELVASIRVLEKNGFQSVGQGSGDRVIRYELRR